MRKQHFAVRMLRGRHLAVSTVEGIGLGALGIGLPDIVPFVGMMLRGIYESAINYGFDYEKSAERMLILKMMEASMAKGTDWEVLNQEVNRLMQDIDVTVV